VRISFRIDFQSSTFGVFFFSKILHFWLRKLSFLIPQSATRCKNTSKSLPSLFFWCPLPVLQVSSRLEHFEFFFVPRVPPLHHFSFLVAHTPTRCKQTSKSLPSLFFWWSPPVLQVSSRLENFEFFLSQGSPLWIISEISIKCKKVAFFVFRDTDPIFWLDTQDCPRNNSKSLPPGVTPCFAEKSALWCAGFCVLLLQPAPQLKKVIFPKFFPYCNSARILHFLYPQTSLTLFYFI